MMMLGPGLHKSIAFNAVGCLCLGICLNGSSSTVCVCPRLEGGTLEIEVRETQSYTAVVKYTYYSQYVCIHPQGKKRKARVFI